MYSSVLKSLIYPAVLTGFNLLANAYVFQDRIERLESRIAGVDKMLRVFDERLQGIEKSVAFLTVRQDQSELRNVAIAEILRRECSKGRR